MYVIESRKIEVRVKWDVVRVMKKFKIGKSSKQFRSQGGLEAAGVWCNRGKGTCIICLFMQSSK